MRKSVMCDNMVDMIFKAHNPSLTFVDPIQALANIIRERDDAEKEMARIKRERDHFEMVLDGIHNIVEENAWVFKTFNIMEIADRITNLIRHTICRRPELVHYDPASGKDTTVLLNEYGIQTHDATGKIRNMADIIHDIQTAMSEDRATDEKPEKDGE